MTPQTKAQIITALEAAGLKSGDDFDPKDTKAVLEDQLKEAGGEVAPDDNSDGDKKTITCTCVNSIYEGGKRYSSGDAIELTPSRLESLGDVVREGAPVGKQVDGASMRNKQVESAANNK